MSSAVNEPPVSAAPSVLPVFPLSNPWPSPEVYLESAAAILALSSVKSRSTRIFVAKETKATKSAGCILVETKLFAAFTARSICSGSMAEKSKKKSINRRSRASKEVALFLAPFSRLPAAAVPETVASGAPAVSG